MERERAKVLTLLHAGDARSDRLVAEAVLRERVATCSRF